MRRLISLILCFVPLILTANNPVVRRIDGGVELRNNHVSIVVSNDAKLISFVDLTTNKDIAAKSNKRIVYVRTVDGETLEASHITLNGNRLMVTVGRYVVNIRVQAYNNYFTVEVLNTKLSGVDVLTFLDLRLNYDANITSIGISGIAMTLQTNPVYYPTNNNQVIIGQCNSKSGIKGAKLAVVACGENKFWSVVETVYQSLPSHNVPVVFASGGVFSHYSEANRQNSVIINRNDVKPSRVPEWIQFYSQWGVKQIGFYMSPLTFNQGDFTFPTLGSAAAFKEQISDPLYKANIISLMYSFSFYISYTSNEILSNPKWQRQLEYRGEYTLSDDLRKEDKCIFVTGDISDIKSPGTYTSVYSPFILIDQEIIRYSINKNGLVNCKRGECGTTASFHKKGSKVMIIGGNFNYIAPQIGSELFYEIARRIANAYNEGGFRGFYFDALDGIGKHLTDAGLKGYEWYYSAAFINEVLKYCEKEPLVVEYSTLFPTIWPARGRGECWDTPHRGYKRFIDIHTSRNKSLIKHHYATVMGWFDFYPEKSSELGNYATKYLFCDDVDYLGAKAIAYDQAMVYDVLNKEKLLTIPAFKRNLDLYICYDSLRRKRYFSEEVKNVLKDGLHEYKLDNVNGEFGFWEVEYFRKKIRDIRVDRLVGENPFNSQNPFIRLENLYSTDYSSKINLMSFNNEIDVMEQDVEKVFEKPVKITNHLGILVKVKGNGTESKDALCVRLQSSGGLSGYADYIIRLNFNGWRDILLPNLDNAENSDLVFKAVGDERYKMHRNDVDYSDIRYVQILNSGDCKGVKVKSIDAVPLIDNPIINPNVRYGTTTVTFVHTLQSGEYIEYDVGNKTAVVYDRKGNSRIIPVRTTKDLVLKNGKFMVSVSGNSKVTNAPTEVALTFGVKGQFVHN